MLPDNAKSKLLKHSNLCYEEYIDAKGIKSPSEEDEQWFKKTFGIVPKSSFIDFYSVVAFPPIGKTNELLSLEQILEYYNDPSFWWDDIDDDIKKQYPDAPKRYLQISTQEGEGGLYYDTKTDAVYDVNWGEEEDMITGKLKPMFNSFYDFLEWYYSEDD